jgi:LPS export ABC transporter protein LptC
MKNREKTPYKKMFLAWLLLGAAAFFACSFDYGESQEDEGQPDIVMQDVEYIRMRDGYPVVRFRAEEARRFEKKQSMELERFKFEQFETRAESVSALGSAGLASVELDSGNIHMKDGVSIEVDSEDLAIATAMLEWLDKERQLFTGEADRVDITRSDGTSFTGWGFSADARRRSWEFKNGAEGTYIEKDDEEAETDEAADDTDDTAPAVTDKADDDATVAVADKTAGAEVDKAGPAAAAPPVPAETEEKEDTEDAGEEYRDDLSAILEGAK